MPAKKVKSVNIGTSFPMPVYEVIQHVVKTKGAFLKDTDLIRYAVNYFLESQGYKVSS